MARFLRLLPSGLALLEGLPQRISPLGFFTTVPGTPESFWGHFTEDPGEFPSDFSTDCLLLRFSAFGNPLRVGGGHRNVVPHSVHAHSGGCP